jgi:hypothetical protein
MTRDPDPKYFKACSTAISKGMQNSLKANLRYLEVKQAYLIRREQIQKDIEEAQVIYQNAMKLIPKSDL